MIHGLFSPSCGLERQGKIQTEGQSYRHASATTINTLPDTVLLEIFDLCLMNHDTRVFPFRPMVEWRRLVHVCHRWQHIVFASPIRLGLQLLCTRGTPVRKNLDHWPPSPLILDYYAYWGADNASSKSLTPGDEDDVIAALEHPDRVRYVRISVTRLLLGKMATVMQDSFPILTHLWLSSDDGNVPVLPKTFLGGSAPRLQVAHLEGIPFLAFPTFLSSATDLVNLQLLNIPKAGFVSPDAMVAGLTTLTMLETLFIEFQSPTPLPDQRPPPPSTRVPFPSLVTFNFRGVSEYLEGLVAQIDAPLLKNVTITYFNQLTFQIPQLSEFISRTEGLYLFRFKHAQVDFGHNSVDVRLDCDQSEQLEGHFVLQILCQDLEWQVSHVAQILGQCFPTATLSSMGDLSVDTRGLQPGWKEDIDRTTEWPALLRPFTAVETLHISNYWGDVAEVLTGPATAFFESEPRSELGGVDL